MKRTLLLLLLLALAVSAFASCKTGSGNKGDGGGQNNSGNVSSDDSIDGDYIYKSGSKIVVLVSSEESSEENPGRADYSELCNEVYQAFAMCDANLALEILPDTSARAKREIMVGRCDRELSRQAYRTLERMEKERI